MLRYLLIYLTCVVSITVFSQNCKYINSDEKQAFEYLNKVRKNPNKYTTDIGIDLSYVERKKPLIWNSILAKVAQEKAEDMARRNYFSHTNPENMGINILIHEEGYLLQDEWIQKSNDNYFESLGAGYSDGVDAIKELIIDDGVNPPGHRNHLLGITEFWSNCYDIGIGFVNSEDINDQSTYSTYICIIIAKKKW